MLQRVASLSAALALVVFVGVSFAADKSAAGDKDTSNSAIRGTVSNVDAHSITITDNNGKDRKLMVEKDAEITCNGKTCKLEDLKNGATVKVLVKKDGDNQVASRIEATTTAAKDKETTKDK